MNKRLIVQLIMHPDCRLIAVDNSDYRHLGLDMDDHVMIDFLVYNEDSEPVSNTLSIKYNPFNRGYYQSLFNTEYVLQKDGTYSYYKLLIPALTHFKKDEDVFGDIVGELFYYDQNIYWFNPESLKDGYFEESTFSFDELMSMCSIEMDCLKWYEIVHENYASQSFYLPVKKVFSVCKLNRQLAKYQKQLLGINNPCKKFGCEIDTYKSRRDMLFGAMYVFDYLKDVGNYREAQRILDNLQACNFMQEDLHSNNDCGCGNSK